VPLRLGSERYTLQYGLNKLVLSGSLFAQMADHYDGEGWYTCTVGFLAGGYTLYFDQFLAVAENAEIYRPEQDYDVLQAFEKLNCVNTEAPVSVSAEYADEGVSVQVTPSAWQVFWVKLALNGKVPTVAELGEYDHIEFVIYASAAADLYFRNTPVATLAAGRNVVSVPIATVLAEIESGKDAAYGLQAYHTDNGETYWQVGSAVTLWLDNFYAVYEEEKPEVPGPVDPSDEEFDETKVEVAGLTAVQTAELNEDYTVLVPEVFYNGTARSVITKVFDQDGNDVELRRGKFLAENEGGYVVKFYIVYQEEEHEVASASIGVADTTGPEITIAVTGSAIGKDSVVAIPAATATDNSGTVASLTVKVTFNGEEVAVTEGADGAPDTFVPAAYGDYIVEYTATDGSGNRSTASVTLTCIRTVTLNDFENGNNSWVAGGQYVPDHAVQGNGLKSTGGDVSVYLDPYYDLSGFDRFTFHVWSDGNYSNGIFCGQHAFALREGNNTISISAEEFAEYYPNGVNIDTSGRPYIFIVVNADIAHIEVVIDEFLGIFDNFEEDTKAPTLGFVKDYRNAEIAVNDASAIVLPEASAFHVYDNSMGNCTIDYTVRKMDGTDITAEVKAGTFKAKYSDGRYIVSYVATDASGNDSKPLELTVTVRALELPAGDDAPADRNYATVQNFDEDGCVVTTDEVNIGLALDETLARKGKAIKVSCANTADQVLKIKLLNEDGSVLTAEDWAAYAYLQISVVSDSDGAKFVFGNESYTLKYGLNILVVSAAAASGSDLYDADGWFTCKVGYLEDGYTLYLDQLLAVEESENVPAKPSDRYDVLQTFGSSASVVTAGASIQGLSTEQTQEGLSVKVVTTGGYQAVRVQLLKDGNG
ncbi:MAG: hypothetical protein K2H43_07435, partial [Clostridia bacterium]|nr:hypothetical protein [Clostridia bacterium]